MKFECKDLERALEVPELMADAREHARNCPACTNDLWVWSEISRVTSGLREEWDSPDLWPRIREKLAPEAPRSRPRNWRLPAAIAAALLVAMVGATWYQFRPGVSGPARDADFLTDQTLKELEQTEAAYVKTIGKLASLVAPKLEKPDSALTAAYREKLQLIDSGIAELRTSIDRNRYNTHLQAELAALYRQKQETLQEILHREHN